MKIKYKDLLFFSKKILLKTGCDIFSANAVSQALCQTSLRGVDSHGIRLLHHYANSALKGNKTLSLILNLLESFIFKFIRC